MESARKMTITRNCCDTIRVMMSRPTSWVREPVVNKMGHLSPLPVDNFKFFLFLLLPKSNPNFNLDPLDANLVEK